MREKRRDFERLFIQPVLHTSGSWTSPRSPLPDERFKLKVDTIDFYGLWASHDTDRKTWTVYPMLSMDEPVDGKPVPVPFNDAILAHVWPSKGSGETTAVAKLLGLAHDFSVQPRNFLILPKLLEAAFDSDAMLLLPGRGTLETPPTVSVRLNQLDLLPPDKQKELADFCASRRSLYLPQASTNKVPFLRVLGWKALSALRSQGEEEGETEVPDFVDANVSVDAEGVPPLRTAIKQSAAVGVRYRALGGGGGGARGGGARGGAGGPAGAK